MDTMNELRFAETQHFKVHLFIRSVAHLLHNVNGICQHSITRRVRCVSSCIT